MATTSDRDQLLARVYRRGYTLRARRRNRFVAAVVAFATSAAVVVLVALPDARGPRTTVVVTTPTTAAPSCRPTNPIVPADRVPPEIARFAAGRPVIGDGALWTVRSALDVAGAHEGDRWILKFPWATRPLGLPRIVGRRLDGRGTFRADVNFATDSRGTWVVSDLEFSAPGCWEVTATYRGSTLAFRLVVGAESPGTTSTAP